MTMTPNLTLAATATNHPPKSVAAKVKMRCENLNFRYGDKLALKAINFTIDEHQVTAMIGPSGCGKSTLLRVLNRMCDLYPDQHAEGTVLLDNENILRKGIDLAVLRTRVGMVFQRPTPFPLTIYENITFGVRLHESLSKADMVERVTWSLTKSALWAEVKDRLHTSALGLSIGQQQRLCIARFIAVKPEVILLDEPTSALDPLSTEKIEQLISELKRDFTIVIVTHNMQQAARCADATAFFYLGELIEAGETARMFTAPTDPRRKDYIAGRFG